MHLERPLVMTGIEILYLVVAMAIMLVGLAGTILPVLPGSPMIFVAALGFAWITGFEIVGSTTLWWLGGIAAVAQLLDLAASAVGVKRFGGTILGSLGAIIGMVVGFIVAGGPIGLVLGAFIGAAIVELARGRGTPRAAGAGLGGILGVVVAGGLKFVLSFVMIVIFIADVAI